MSLRETLIYNGNVNRIMEFHENGWGALSISGVMKEAGIDIEPYQVKALVDTREALSAKAFPKRRGSKLIRERDAAMRKRDKEIDGEEAE